MIFLSLQERQIQKGFQIAKTEGMGAGDVFALTALKLQKQNSQMSNRSKGSVIGSRGTSVRNKKELTSKQKFKGLALKAIKQENEGDAETPKIDPIGSTKNSIIRRNRSLRRSLLHRGNSLEETDKLCLSDLNTDQLVTYNPKLASFSPTTRIAYAKFKNVVNRDLFAVDERDELVKSSPSASVHVERETEKLKVKLDSPPNGGLKSPLKDETLVVEKQVKSAEPSPARPRPSSSPMKTKSPENVKPPPTPKKTPKKVPEPPVTPPQTPVVKNRAYQQVLDEEF